MSKVAKNSETPLMRQYNAIKVKHPGALLLFRVGDFYETFGEDAVKASKILDIVLTKRSNGSASEVELAGFPHHALDNYLPKLVRAGYRVAICDQLEDPKMVKGIVKRGVTELVTPGLSLNDNVLEKKTNNYLASVYLAEDIHGVAFLDLSTGEFLVSSGDIKYIDTLFQRFNPSEIIYCKRKRSFFEDHFSEVYNTYCLEEWVYQYDYAYEKLTGHFGTKNLKGFGVENLAEGITAAGAILFYLEETEHRDLGHISGISRIAEEKYVWLDRFTIRNLELLNAQQEGGIPLIQILDQTATPMGARLLKKWVLMPLKEKAAIEERHEVVEALVQDEDLSSGLESHLKHIGDLERLISKVAVGRINPREMVQLKKSLRNLLPVKELLSTLPIDALKKLADQINPCQFLLQKIDAELKEDLPLVSNLGGMIREGIHPELDELRSIQYSGKDFLMQLQKKEMLRTGISSLKVAYNKVFGYYLEVSNAHKSKVPPEWIRKQTLVNAERYITEELKVYEEKILSAEEKIFVIEQKIFQELIRSAADYVLPVQQNARITAMIDCLLSFAILAGKHKYIRPHLSEEAVIDIKEGRHPVIEQQLPPGEPYIPNDVYLDDQSQQIMIITGPNMAGKSALLRQTALIVLLAQMGSFVPATYVRMGITDKIFTRVGASDNLSRGESTFMVEMTETASILNNLSNNSLILMDEIGRGTATYDGISIAWSIVEYLHKHPRFKAKTLFATHYHELNQLANDFPRIKNFNVAVKESGDKIIFMRKLQEGGSEHSFGIHVAQMAGMPNQIVLRANEIMRHLEKDKISKKTDRKIKDIPAANYQLNLFDSDPKFEKIKDMLAKVDINSIAPVEALLKLNEILTLLKGR
ncbi:MAG: DNA mismatch repair protein MutS [Cyclobacteriaceae bacterium]|nr:DNA mismatch repair protein MutS [Cyclobacteriaceae bacterium]